FFERLSATGPDAADRSFSIRRHASRSQDGRRRTQTMKLKTGSGEIYFNPQLISHVYLNPDSSLLTVHFIDGTHSGFTVETEVERAFAAELLAKLTDQTSGFVSIGNEVLNLKAALWIGVPHEGPIQIRLGDNRTRIVDESDRVRIIKLLAE